MLVTLLVLFSYMGQSVAWDNNWDGRLYKVCDTGSSFFRLRSEHHDWHKDRRYQFDCKENKVSGSCYWTGHVNHFDQLIEFQCKPDHVVTGVDSWHSRFKLRCCRMRYAKLKKCHWTATISWDKYMDYTAPDDSVIRGIKSWHNDWHKGRRWQVYICRKK